MDPSHRSSQVSPTGSWRIVRERARGGPGGRKARDRGLRGREDVQEVAAEELGAPAADAFDLLEAGEVARRVGGQPVDHPLGEEHARIERLLHAPIAPYAGAAYGTYDERLRFIGGINVAVTEHLSALVTYNGEHYNSIFSLSRGRYTGSLLFVSGGDVGAAWNVTW